jgi:hypothetical protein
LQLAKEALAKAQAWDIKYANQHQRHVEYQVDEQVLLWTKNLKFSSTISTKFVPKYVGPFSIVKRIGPVAYQLQLLPEMQVHNVFYVNLLKPYINPIDPLVIVQPGPIDYIEDDNTFEVDSILDYRTHCYGRGLRQEYLVAWKGYPITEATWEFMANLTNCHSTINDYHSRTHHSTRTLNLI